MTAQFDWDDAYANGAYIEGADDYPARWDDAAAEWREVEHSIGRARLNLPYGEGARHRFDLFLPAGKPEGVVVFVHGGYWRAFDNKSWSHLAAGATARGWAVAMPSYTLSPEARIDQITEEIRQALHKIAETTRGPIVLTGHSAGGHLVSRMLCRDVPLSPEVAERLQKVVPISPLSDLRPLIQTQMNDDFRMDEAAAIAESPVMEADPRPVPVTVWVGADERPVFLDQARWLADAWGAGLHIADGLHHFDVIDALAEPDSALTSTLFDQKA